MTRSRIIYSICLFCLIINLNQCFAYSISNRKTGLPGEIASQKCREYQKYVTLKKKPPILLIDDEEVESRECGFQVAELVVGGEETKDKEFPHMALLGFDTAPNKTEWLCGGSIISEQYILTAAHCLYHRHHGSAKFVRMGIRNLNDKTYMQQIKVANLIPHPKFTPPLHYHDIALIKLEKPATMTPYARPACLFVNGSLTTSKAIATGWGATDFAGYSKSDVLLKVGLDFFPFEKCNNSYKQLVPNRLTFGIVDQLQVCAGSKTEEKDTCQGDSGGPLQVYNLQEDIKCMYDIVGITSFGNACGIAGRAGVYTRVSSYIQWIESVVWPQG